MGYYFGSIRPSPSSLVAPFSLYLDIIDRRRGPT
jgi:hypothetical protein